jgi:hypothetical protein
LRAFIMDLAQSAPHAQTVRQSLRSDLHGRLISAGHPTQPATSCTSRGGPPITQRTWGLVNSANRPLSMLCRSRSCAAILVLRSPAPVKLGRIEMQVEWRVGPVRFYWARCARESYWPGFLAVGIA